MRSIKKQRRCLKKDQKSNKDIVEAFYEEISLNLSKCGWESRVRNIREFFCIYIKDLSISIFISENTLFIVKGNILPPIIYKEDINKPEFDIIKSIDLVCKKLFLSPEKL